MLFYVFKIHVSITYKYFSYVVTLMVDLVFYVVVSTETKRRSVIV